MVFDAEGVDGFDHAVAVVAGPGAKRVIVATDVAISLDLLGCKKQFVVCGGITVVGVDVDPVEALIGGCTQGVKRCYVCDANTAAADFLCKLALNHFKLRRVESSRGPGVHEYQLRRVRNLHDLPRQFALIDATFHHDSSGGQPSQ